MVFVTGHECAGKSARPNQVDWAALAQTGATLCIYMGVRRLADISETLQDGGLAGTTPVAIVADATLEEQTVHVTTLAEAPIFSESLLSRPSLIIVGEVVRWAELHDTMISMQAAGV